MSPEYYPETKGGMSEKTARRFLNDLDRAIASAWSAKADLERKGRYEMARDQKYEAHATEWARKRFLELLKAQPRGCFRRLGAWWSEKTRPE